MSAAATRGDAGPGRIGAGSTAVHLSNVRVTFPTKAGQTVAVDGLSLSIPTGGVYCLLGPNGAGKTTTINVITGLVRADSGTVEVFGYSPARDRTAVLQRVALVPQETALYESLTARENLSFHGRYYGLDRETLNDRIDDILEVIGLAKRQSDRVATYSGGMRRRLALGRALMSDAHLLLLDEPTLGVDVQSRNAIWQQIRRLADRGRAVLLTTNYMDEAEELADTILLMDQGREVVSGTAGDLKGQVGQQSLLLDFGTEHEARDARDAMVAERPATVTGRRLRVELDAPAEGVALLRRLPYLLGEAFREVEGFELREPSLQDVFLHFTGRALRD